MRNRCRWLAFALALFVAAIAPLAAADEAEEAAPSKEGETNLADLLSQASGVRVATMCTNCNVANVTMLGQTGDRVQIWQDGLPVVGGVGGIYLLSVLPSEGIAATEIIRGAGTVTTGSEAAVGAVVLKMLDPSSLKSPLFMAAVDGGSLDWFGQRFMAFGGEGDLAGGFTFTHAQSGPSDPNQDSNFDLGSFDRTTFAGTGTYSFSKRSRVRLDALSYREEQRGNKGGFSASAANRFWKEDIDIDRNEVSLAWDVGFSDGSKLTFSGRRSRRKQDTSDDAPGIVQPYMSVEESSTAGEARYERTVYDRHHFIAGVTARRLFVDGRSVHGGEVLRTDTVNHEGAYAQIEFVLPKRFDLTVGLRWDDYAWEGQGGIQIPDVEPTTGRSMLLPRARIAWKATKSLALSLSGGKALAAPRPVFERVCCGQDVLPNDFAQAESSTNYLLDVDYVPRRWLKLRGSLFRDEYSDYHQKLAIFAFDFIPTIGLTNYSPFTLEGAELSFELRVRDRFSFGAEAASLRKKGDDPVGVRILNDTVFELAGDRMIPFVAKRQGSAFAKWDDAAAGFEASLQAQYTGRLYVQELPEGFGVCDQFVSTPSFWVLNLRAEKSIGDRFSVFGGVDNITDEFQTNLESPRYDYQWGPLRGRYYYAGLRWTL